MVKRSDGCFACQLAVVADDEWQGITHVVRGADLLESTPRQRWLQDVLGYSHPDYRHVPPALNRDGRKLSKQTLAQALNPAEAVAEICLALEFLGQPCPFESGDPKSVLDQAVAAWSLEWHL